MYSEYIKEITKYASIFKHPSFSEEKEWRIIHETHDDENNRKDQFPDGMLTGIIFGCVNFNNCLTFSIGLSRFKKSIGFLEYALHFSIEFHSPFCP